MAPRFLASSTVISSHVIGKFRAICSLTIFQPPQSARGHLVGVAEDRSRSPVIFDPRARMPPNHFQSLVQEVRRGVRLRTSSLWSASPPENLPVAPARDCWCSWNNSSKIFQILLTKFSSPSRGLWTSQSGNRKFRKVEHTFSIQFVGNKFVEFTKAGEMFFKFIFFFGRSFKI